MHTRVVCLIYDRDEYRDELKALKDAARKLGYRNNLRVGVVDDPKMIKILRKTPNFGHFFQDVGLSTCALKRYDDRFFYLDLTSNNEPVDFVDWIS